ncbi:hypothetical protein QUR76_06990 [Arcobacter cryaerophilus gv. pseudocryaerophilus]|nr:hypothetical protein RMQ65_01105 [Arcobacter sp. AZ-2023]WPD04872.1 hypothetical protein QUR76_06990 [Arcobacter sp. DSM 115956]
MFYILLPFRAYARNRVYNYVLQNNVYLKRLEDKNYVLENGVYYPLNLSKKDYKLRDKGYIKYKKVSKLEYFLALFIWIWFDDDSNYDTHDGSEIEETILKPFGNTWDLGDLRGKYPIVGMKKTFFWICRNTFYNANYLFEEIRENDKNFFYIQFSKIGWHFGYIPYSNSTRKGRLVYFSEDFDKLDKELIK